ncbi:hypothetical protein CAPTEDRAFT_202925 [Capitella teleta]|uniref:Uncharacterized protein n=1 Tax=Capitella teleta TaxID=283909 RepID=R7TY48_CAPTE|nr:hypothetical protein CAPTEDRAFT_202925 [Capitella teleta]|eukprot:ELT95885.1 hypothetical protein CAPTEDRAFT_202925 [Capitella teleta]
MVSNREVEFAKRKIQDLHYNMKDRVVSTTGYRTGHMVYNAPCVVVIALKLPSELEAREVPALVVPEHSWMQDVPLLVGTNALRVGEGQAEQGALRVRLRKAVVLPPNATSTVEGEVDQLKAAQNSIVGEVGVLEMISQITLPAGVRVLPTLVEIPQKGKFCLCSVLNLHDRHLHRHLVGLHECGRHLSGIRIWSGPMFRLKE